jgi:hypothetical protein
MYKTKMAYLINMDRTTKNINSNTGVKVDVNSVRAFQDILKLFKKRTYGSENTDATDSDLKLVNAIIKVNLKYKLEKEKRKYTVALKYEDIPSLAITPLAIKPLCEPKVVCSCCPATKMDGKICNAKLKPGKSFCGRHAKLESVQ